MTLTSMRRCALFYFSSLLTSSFVSVAAPALRPLPRSFSLPQPARGRSEHFMGTACDQNLLREQVEVSIGRLVQILLQHRK